MAAAHTRRSNSLTTSLLIVENGRRAGQDDARCQDRKKAFHTICRKCDIPITHIDERYFRYWSFDIPICRTFEVSTYRKKWFIYTYHQSVDSRSEDGRKGGWVHVRHQHCNQEIQRHLREGSDVIRPWLIRCIKYIENCGILLNGRHSIYNIEKTETIYRKFNIWYFGTTHE